jgi:hypothetical protein
VLISVSPKRTKSLASPRKPAHTSTKSLASPRRPKKASASPKRHKRRRQTPKKPHRSKDVVNDIVMHIQSLKVRDSCGKIADRHSFEFVKCGVEHYNRQNPELAIIVKPHADSKGNDYKEFNQVMKKYLHAIVERK